MPLCYVCARPVAPVPMREQLAARRSMNIPVWLLSPGIDSRFPDGIVRHSYCAAGSERWLASLTNSAADLRWKRYFTDASGVARSVETQSDTFL